MQSRNRLDERNIPNVVLWAWERPEDLDFLDPHRYSIAFLAQTLVLTVNEVSFNPRRQPLKVLPGTKLIAVTRIESQKTTGQRPGLTDPQREELVALILKTLDLANVSAIQIDFDAAQSEREFYRSLLQELRRKIPDDVPLSMTALASFCIGDRWLQDLPVDEAVPMIFRMGTDDGVVKTFLTEGNDFREPICGRSYGISVDEPLTIKFDDSRRLYIFNAHAWKPEDLSAFERRALK